MLFVCMAGMYASRSIEHHNLKDIPSTPKPNFNPPAMSKDEHEKFLIKCCNSECGKMFISPHNREKIKRKSRQAF